MGLVYLPPFTIENIEINQPKVGKGTSHMDDMGIFTVFPDTSASLELKFDPVIDHDHDGSTGYRNRVSMYILLPISDYGSMGLRIFSYTWMVLNVGLY